MNDGNRIRFYNNWNGIPKDDPRLKNIDKPFIIMGTRPNPSCDLHETKFMEANDIMTEMNNVWHNFEFKLPLIQRIKLWFRNKFVGNIH